MTEFAYHDMFPLGTDTTTYRRLDGDGLIRSGSMDGEPVVRIDREAIRLLTAEAIRDISHLFRTSHLQQLRKILDDHDASANDHFVARTLLQNAAISSGMVLPSCQDTGTAIIMGKKGQHVWTDPGTSGFSSDAEAISRGACHAA